MPLVLIVHVLSTWFMAGVIWIVQIVHYPLFEFADPQRYAAFQAAHMRKITWIVFPAMSIELLSGLALVYRAPTDISWALWLNLLLLAFTWLVTATVQVPQHGKLLAVFDSQVHQKLVRGNWFRTLAWSVRSLLLAGVTWTLHFSEFPLFYE